MRTSMNSIPQSRAPDAFAVKAGDNRIGKLYIDGEEFSVKISSRDTNEAFSSRGFGRAGGGPPLHRSFTKTSGSIS